MFWADELAAGLSGPQVVNDSKTPLGSNVDRHAGLGDGELGKAGCAVFLSEPRFEGLPVVLETPGDTKKGWVAEDLRKEGYTVTGGH